VTTKRELGVVETGLEELSLNGYVHLECDDKKGHHIFWARKRIPLRTILDPPLESVVMAVAVHVFPVLLLPMMEDNHSSTEPSLLVLGLLVNRSQSPHAAV